MADQPKPRSYQSILSDILDVFLSKYPINTLKVGSPLLTIMEAAAQSDLRSTQDLFNLLEADSLNQATGQALLRKAADENIQPIKLTKASGLVNFVDKSFQKISTNIYQGGTTPVIGTTALKVTDASKFLPQGQLYIGRNTVNYEGPLAYTAVTNNGSYWTITLSSGTTKPHNLGETVILAQGGDRTLESGTTVQTPQSISEAIKFTILRSGIIPDGETELKNIEVLAQTPGTIGNVPANTITQFASVPFIGASVYNPLPFTNGLDAEDESSLKERIKDVRQSKSKATALAIKTKVKGISSSIDNKTVVSASITDPQTSNPTLIIDDGTGYEEKISGVSSETLIDSALGGEQFFQLAASRPIAKASVTTSIGAPYILSDGSILSVNIGGVLSSHTFNASDFREIGNALAYEIVASINGDASLLWNARTSENGTKVTIFAKSETNEDIQVLASGENDANDVLAFPTSRVYTLKLYTDRLLNKDGNRAFVITAPQSTWSNTIQTGDTLILKVDNTSEQTITVLDSDFLNNSTGFNSVNANNGLDAWATVLNTKIIGATATVNSGVLTLTSNLGASKRAAIEILGGTLISKGMFVVGKSVGSESDYTLNRNTAQLKLSTPLSSGDSLTAASEFTSAFAQSTKIDAATVTLTSEGKLWVVTDGRAKVLNTNVTTTSSFNVTSPDSNKARYTAANGTFGTGTTGFIAANDWVIIWDSNFNDLGAFRISEVDTTNWAWFDVDYPVALVEVGVSPTDNGMVFVRTDEQIQTISIPAGTYSLTSLANLLNNQLIGATARVFQTNQLRLTTDTLSGGGDISVITADAQGQLLQLPLGTLYTNKDPHYAVIESGNSVLGTPHFQWTSVATVPDDSTLTGDLDPAELKLRSGDLLRFRKRLDTTSYDSFGQNANEFVGVESINANTITHHTNSKLYKLLAEDRFYASNPYIFGPNDTLSVIVDQDNVSKTFDIPLFKNVKPAAGEIYSTATFNVLDIDTDLDLSNSFGTDFSFNDFALYMKARGKSHSVVSNKAILWRYSRFGAEGENVAVRYVYPSSPSKAWGLSTSTDSTTPYINITLPSGIEKTGLNTAGNNYFVVGANTVFKSSPGPIVDITRASNVVTITTSHFNAHNLKVGSVIYQTSTDDANFPSGPKVITALGGNTFSYSETGVNATYSGSANYVVPKLPAGDKFTVTSLSSAGTTVTATTSSAHSFAIGDTIYFLPGHKDSGIEVASGAKTVTAITSTTISWNEGISQTATATLKAGVAYTVSAGQCVEVFVDYYKATVGVAGLSRSSSVVTVAPETSALVSKHPFKVGDVVYLTSGDANFPSGPKLITSVFATTFKYIEAGPDGSNTDTVFFTSTATDLDFIGGGSPVVVGDIVHIDSGTSLDIDIVGEHRINSVSSTDFSFLVPDTDYAGNDVPAKINAINNLRFYPIDTSLATAAQAVTFANTTSTVSAALVPANGELSNDGTGIIAKSTQDEYLLSENNASVNGTGQTSVSEWNLFDGLNWVHTTTMGSDSGVSLKNTVNGELTTNADFSNEVFKLVPTTLDNLVDYLNNAGAGGFYSNGTAAASKDGRSLQLSSDVIGSSGAIQVTGGTGNTSTATVYGSGQIINDFNGDPLYGKLTVSSGQVDGFTGSQYVSLQGSDPALKTISLDATKHITISAGDAANEFLIHFDTNVIDVLQAIASDNVYQIEKHGNFMAYIDNSAVPTALSSDINEGDWVYLNSDDLNAANVGIWQVVRIDPASNTFWVENANGVEEVTSLGASGFVKFISYNSVIPGDVLSIGTSLLGTANIGNWVVNRLKESGSTTTLTDFYVTGTLTAIGSTLLGNDYSLIKIKEKSPVRLIKRIHSIIPNTTQIGFSDIIFDTSSYIERISSSFGAIVTALDKLNFSTALVVGIDGYSYNTGLLSEVNRVVYGDENNPTQYPGEVAAGANLNISGPLIRRIQVSLGLRLRNNNSSIIDRVKNAVAAYINSIPVGTSIAISSIVSAANGIDGVVAVTVISPTYSGVNDLIYVQANEKPRILNIDNDILISVVGN